MLGSTAIERLTRDLALSTNAMGLQSGSFGKPELVEKPMREAERIFQGYAKAKPTKEDAYSAARTFLQGRELDAWQRDLVASAVSEPVREHAGAMVLGSPRFSALLESYEDEAQRGDLWRLTWHGLLYSYFNFDPSATKHLQTFQGWEMLRVFLERTWPLIDRQAGMTLFPDWVGVLRRESDVLTSKPAEKFSRAYLRGDTEATDQLAADLGIPPSSWFWHELVLGAVKRAVADSDAEFRRLIPQLLQLIQGKPAFRDRAVEAILIRYHACQGAPQDERLRDFVCQQTVWKNPKLKSAGIATAWNRVPDPVWRMVLSWVNERNLKEFFDILAARNKADEGRLAFWSKYLKQITWTRLVFGSDTMALKRSNAEVRDLIAREEGSYAELTANKEVDAFMMQIGSYLVIEFSKKPNACYVYQADKLPFEPYNKYYAGGTDDLRAGFHKDCAARITHPPGWEQGAFEKLRGLGIRPDPASPASVSAANAATARDSVTSTSAANSATSPLSSSSSPGPDSGPDMDKLRALVSRFSGATMYDKRRNGSGNLWVSDPLQRAQLETELKALGFMWAMSRNAWYLRGD
jgi:hypothetical protein